MPTVQFGLFNEMSFSVEKRNIFEFPPIVKLTQIKYYLAEDRI